MALSARLEEPLSRWLWLVKWLLLIPHYVVLFFLWLAFMVVAFVAFFAILFTGRYPRSLFHFNLGVLRWGWRVAYYGYSALGTDRYPPFTLGPAPDYPATLDIVYPPALSRGLVLVKWWLLALPHYVILAFVVSGTWTIARGVSPTGPWAITVSTGGLLGIIVFFAAVALLFTARYPRGIFDLALGFDRWVVRVAAYVTLMTDEYPPFRLDQGGSEPAAIRGGPQPGGEPSAAAAGVPVGQVVPAGTSPASQGSAAGSVVALVAGLLAFVVACGLAGLGIAGLWLNSQRDASGFVSTRDKAFVSSTAAMTVEDVDLTFDRDTAVWSAPDEFGNIRVQATAAGENAIFIGIAPQSDVDAWLGGVAHERVQRITGDSVAAEFRPGSARASPPVDQDFWDVQAVGTGTQTIVWPVRSGTWAFVVANADGQPGVRAAVDVGASIPSLTGASVAFLLAGAAALLVAIGLIVLGATGLGRHHAARSAHPDAGWPPPHPNQGAT